MWDSLNLKIDIIFCRKSYPFPNIFMYPLPNYPPIKNISIENNYCLIILMISTRINDKSRRKNDKYLHKLICTVF